ncbi:MAG TPA: acyl-CoA dehydrogenase [Paraburkholderia sp.]|nr:acyl-CoA dehydrogenase [Paraburkholderia sp.]
MNTLADRLDRTETTQLADPPTAAAALVPTLRSRAVQTQALSRLPDDTIADFEQARLFDMVVPKMYGGHQSSLETYLDTLIEVGRGDGSAAWVLGLLSTGTWMVATMYPQHVTDQVFAPGSRFRTATTLNPRKATVRRVAGGYVIEDGLWMYNSGFYHAHWDLLGIPLVDDAGRVTGLGSALLPAADVTPLHDWDTIGLRGSGSTNVTVKGVFVPDERIALMSRNLQDDYASPHLRGEPEYRFPLVPLLTTRLLCPMLGMARAAVELLMDKIGTRGIAFMTYGKQAEAPVTHLRIGEATAKIDAAESIVRNSIRLLDTAAARGDRLSVLQRARLWRDAGYATQLIWEGVDQIAAASGTAFINRDTPLSHVWHDVRVASIHGALLRDTCLEIFGRLAAGMPANTMLLPELSGAPQ